MTTNDPRAVLLGQVPPSAPESETSETWRHDADQYVFLPGAGLPLNLNTEEGAAYVLALHRELLALRSETQPTRNNVLEEAAKICHARFRDYQIAAELAVRQADKLSHTASAEGALSCETFILAHKE